MKLRAGFAYGAVYLIAFTSSAAAYTAMTLPGSLFSVMNEPKEGPGSKSELGMAFYEGNTNTNLTALSQEFSYRWPEETAQVLGQFLEQNADDKLKAERWKLAARYERRLMRNFGLFMVESTEGNQFAGYLQRYASDVGVRHNLWKGDRTKGAMELGFRYQSENQISGNQFNSVIARLFFEAAYLWNEHTNAVVACEYLPVVDQFSNWRVGVEADINVILTDRLNLKTSYGIRYASDPSAFGVKNLDRSFITSLVATF